jgi:hypothetical protein
MVILDELCGLILISAVYAAISRRWDASGGGVDE